MEPEATSSRSPGTADRIGLALLLLAGAATLIVLGSVRHWYWHPDEHDNMAVGWLLSRGHVLYRDVFSHHMPLPYLLVEAEMRLAGPLDPADLRAGFALLSAAFLALTGWLLRRTVPLWIFAALSAGWGLLAPGFLGHLLLADNLFALGVVPLVLAVAFPVAMDGPRAAWLAASCFLCIGSTAIAVYPVAIFLLVAGARALAIGPAAKRRGGRGTDPDLGPIAIATCLALPFLLLAALLVARGGLADFFAQAYEFNTRVYGAFLDPPVRGPFDPLAAALSDLARVAAGLLPGAPGPPGADPVGRAYERMDGWTLIAAVVSVATLMRERPARALALAAFLIATRCRGGIFHGNPWTAAALFSLAVPLEQGWRAATSGPERDGRRRSPSRSGAARGPWRRVVVVGAAVALVACALAVHAARWWTWLGEEAKEDVFAWKWRQDRLAAEVAREDEPIWVAPLDPLLYLNARRVPAAFAVFYLPWQAAAPEVADRVGRELRRNPPPVVVFRRRQPIRGRLPEDYAAPILSLLEKDYVSLAGRLPETGADPGLEDFWIRRDRWEEILARPPAARPAALRGVDAGVPRDGATATSTP